MTVASATLNAREERRLLRGHLWAYRNEFKQLPGVEDGALLDVFAENRRFVGRGFYQAEGGIAVRLLTGRQEEIDAAFFAERIARARALREQLFPGQNVYRWVFGESDALPGFVADRYDAVVSIQSSCAFYRPWAEALAALFLDNDGIEGVRMQLGGDVLIFGQVPERSEFLIEGLRCGFQLEGAQKTGMFLDQRLNCLTVRPFARGARVLDGHCYAGLWSCHAALAGAESVFGVDTSSQAVAQARANAELNGVADRCAFSCEEVEAALARPDHYTVVILDPPAFAKSRALKVKALARYHALNTAALKALEPDGILITSSCSHFVAPEDFVEMLKQAASAARRRVTLLELRGASPDHPVLLSMPETAYLKCAVLRVR